MEFSLKQMIAELKSIYNDDELVYEKFTELDLYRLHVVVNRVFDLDIDTSPSKFQTLSYVASVCARDKNVLFLLYLCESDEAFHLSYNYWIEGITSHFKAAEYNLSRVRSGKYIK